MLAKTVSQWNTPRRGSEHKHLHNTRWDPAIRSIHSTPGHIIPRETLISALGDARKELSRRMFVVRKTKTHATSKDKRMDKLQLCIRSEKDRPAAHTAELSIRNITGNEKGSQEAR